MDISIKCMALCLKMRIETKVSYTSLALIYIPCNISIDIILVQNLQNKVPHHTDQMNKFESLTHPGPATSPYIIIEGTVIFRGPQRLVCPLSIAITVCSWIVGPKENNQVIFYASREYYYGH